MQLTATSPVGTMAAEHPLATRVFARHGIDFCCGGGVPLEQACSARGLDPAQVLAEIQVELETEKEEPQRWSDAPLAELIEHILTVYHRPLDEELPRLEVLARKVARVHHDKDPERLNEMLDVYIALKDELQQHMMKEERILFPMILSGAGTQSGPPIRVMRHEHETAGAALAQLRTLTDDYQVPEQACNSWRALWHGLAALETALHEHIHLENNILFPRALAG